MKSLWLNKKNHNSLIIFFNGWGMDENAIFHLGFGDFDCMMFFDYQNLETSQSIFDEINKYDKKYLIGWSMGVMVASIFAEKIKNLTASIAINGTLFPIDEKYGILPKAYTMMIKGFSDSARIKFIEKMFKNSDDLKKISPSKRKLDEQREELISLMSYNSDESFGFDCAIISDDDKIITSKNQQNFWQTRPQTKIINLDAGHYPFLKYSSWDQIIYELR